MLSKLLPSCLNWKDSVSPSGDTPEGGGRQLLCSMQPPRRLQGGLFLSILDILNYRGKRSSPQIYRFSKFRVSASTFLMGFCFYHPPHICLHLVPSNLSPSKCNEQFFSQHFHTAAVPLNQPVRETFPHCLSKRRPLSPFSLNHPGLMPRMGNVQFWTNDNFSLPMKMCLCLAFSFPTTEN